MDVIVKVSVDAVTWTTVVSRSVFADTSTFKRESFPDIQARYVQIVAYTEAGNRGPWTSASEFGVILRATTNTPTSSSSSRASTIATTTSSSTSNSLNTSTAFIVGVTVDSFQNGNEGTKAIDGSTNSIWHSRYDPAQALPHNAVLDLGTALSVTGITYLPRQDVRPGGKINGNIGKHTIDTSTDNINWITAAQSTYADDSTLKTETFSAVIARYVRVTALTEAGNRGPWTSAAEFTVLVTSSVTTPTSPSRGKWGSVISLPLVAAGAFLLPDTGNVLTFSASGRTDFDAKGNTNTATYNPWTGAVSQRNVIETKHDMFCPGLSLDSQGRAVVTGGNDHRKVSLFSPSSDSWSTAPELKLLRGYQSSTILSDGRIFTIGGSWLEPEYRGGKNGEIFDPVANSWTLLNGCPVAPMLTNDAGGIFRQDNHVCLHSLSRLPSDCTSILRA